MSPEANEEVLKEVGQAEAQRPEGDVGLSWPSIASALLSLGIALLSMFTLTHHRPPPINVLGFHLDLSLLDPNVGVAVSAILLLLAVVFKKLKPRRRLRSKGKPEDISSESYEASLASIKSTIEELRELYRTLSFSIEELKSLVKEAMAKPYTSSSSTTQASEAKEEARPAQLNINEGASRVLHGAGESTNLNVINDDKMILDLSLIARSLEELRKTVKDIHRRAVRNA